MRCTAPHPEVKGWVCRAKLNVAVPPSYEVKTRPTGRADCLRVTCWRCGTTYDICPTGRVA